MVSRKKVLLLSIGAVLLLGVLWLAGCFGRFGMPGPFHYVIEREDTHAAKQKYQLFTDDDPSSKNPQFDPKLVDNRPVIESAGNPWELNASAATIRLDIEDTLNEDVLLKLHATYAAAVASIRSSRYQVLPSLNLLDGKAKQFDDGLYAELDAGMTKEKLKAYAETGGLVLGIMDKLDRKSNAYAWLWGALSIGGFLNETHRAEPNAGRGQINLFDNDETQSKPMGFYTWSDELRRTFRFVRYLMKEHEECRTVPREIAAVLATNPELHKTYQSILEFYGRLTNPYAKLSFAPLANPANAGKDFKQLYQEAGWEPNLSANGLLTASFLPYSGSKEVRLFNRLFGVTDPPPEVDLMLELVKAIRSGKVNLKPDEKSGWYDHQVYALETFLLPDRGAESSKLILSKKYKERMLQAFAALITKRRETHARQLLGGECAKPTAPRAKLAPRLRVEPNPTFFLRTARAYAFLENFLNATLPAETLKSLRGRKQDGERAMPLAEELSWMKNFFYGLHLISCEDIGLRPEIMKDEPVDAPACTTLASGWLAKWDSDPDLTIDTRIAVPIFIDDRNLKTRLWGTLGVRGAKLQAEYVQGPSWRPAKADATHSDWQKVPPHQLSAAHYVILVDEFAEIELKGLRVLNREELRKVCDREGTKEAIVKALE